jgi:hypothetical protein
MLFPNLALLCGIGFGVLRDHPPASEHTGATAGEIR